MTTHKRRKKGTSIETGLVRLNRGGTRAIDKIGQQTFKRRRKRSRKAPTYFGLP